MFDLYMDELVRKWNLEAKEVIRVAEEGGDELAGRMADMTIGAAEDEIAEAQLTMHELRVVEAKRKEQRKLLLAERRRIDFALEELKDD